MKLVVAGDKLKIPIVPYYQEDALTLPCSGFASDL
jgi:hypothetical protein